MRPCTCSSACRMQGGQQMLSAGRVTQIAMTPEDEADADETAGTLSESQLLRLMA